MSNASIFLNAAGACTHNARMELGAYPCTDYLKAAEYLRAAREFSRAADDEMRMEKLRVLGEIE